MTLAEFGQKCSGARLFSEVLFSCVPMVNPELDAEDSKMMLCGFCSQNA